MREEVADGDFIGGHGNYSDVDGRRRKLRATPGSKTVVVPTKGELVVYKGTRATEEDAEYDSWFLLVPLEGGAAAGEATVMED